MIDLEALKAHKGSLIRLKTELCWHNGRGYDGSADRVCLILDVAASTSDPADADDPDCDSAVAFVEALLLIDGSSHWVWMSAKDVELLSEKL